MGILRREFENRPMRRRSITKSTIRPKISTMPRQKSEAAAFLDIYKLVIEKKRLQEELENIDERRQQIQQRLAVLHQQVATMEQQVQIMREQGNLPPEVLAALPSLPLAGGANFDTLYLEY